MYRSDSSLSYVLGTLAFRDVLSRTTARETNDDLVRFGRRRDGIVVGSVWTFDVNCFLDGKIRQTGISPNFSHKKDSKAKRTIFFFGKRIQRTGTLEMEETNYRTATPVLPSSGICSGNTTPTMSRQMLMFRFSIGVP